jgi:UDP-glucose 4-epimerase
LQRDVEGVFNVSSGIESSVNKIFKLISNATGYQGEKRHVEYPFKELRRSSLSFKKASDILGWRPYISLEEGIKRTHGYFRSNMHLYEG